MKAITKVVLFGLICFQCYAQPNFENHPLVTLPGYNTEFKISSSPPWGESVYLCWANHVDSSEFRIYRMALDPHLGTPELVTSSTHLLSSPDVNSDGDVVWEEWIGETAIIKHYASNVDRITTLTSQDFNSTQPNISSSLMIYIQDDTLRFVNLENQMTHIIDWGNISNPDIAPELYTSTIIVVYEKNVGNEHIIRKAIKSMNDAEYEYYDYGAGAECANPRFGTTDLFSFQELVDSTWGISNEFATLIRPYDLTNPFMVHTGIITARDVNDYSMVFESDSIVDNREIVGTSATFDRYSTIWNISNIPGNDYNPQVFFTSTFDSVVVIWEHEVENGRELWWAKDSLLVPINVEPGRSTLPETFLVGKAYPNPFNGNARIDYAIEKPSVIEISVFDLKGRQVSSTVENKPAGTYIFDWNGFNSRNGSLDSGVYVVKFNDGGSVQTRKLVLLK